MIRALYAWHTVGVAKSPRAAWSVVAVAATVMVSCGGSTGISTGARAARGAVADSGYRTACSDRPRQTTGPSRGLQPRRGIFPPPTDALAASPDLAAYGFARSVFGLPRPQLIICSQGNEEAVVRVVPDQLGPTSEILVRAVIEGGWEVLEANVDGASFGMYWPDPAQRSQPTARGVGDVVGWTLEVLDPTDYHQVLVTKAVAASDGYSWQAPLQLPAIRSERLIFLLYKPALAAASRQTPAAIAVALAVS